MTVDSTATAYIVTKGDKKPEKAALEAAMKPKGKRGHKVTSLKSVKRLKPAAAYEVELKGLK